MKKTDITFVSLLAILMSVTMLFTSCGENTPSTESSGTSSITTSSVETTSTEASSVETSSTESSSTEATSSEAFSTEPTQCNHNYTSKVTTAATCTKDGVKTFTCSMCNDSYTEKIAATGNHNYTSKVTTAATCTKDGVKTFTCSMCNDSYTEKIAASHNWVNATCSEPKTCSVCSTTEGSALGHKVENDKCARCGKTPDLILGEYVQKNGEKQSDGQYAIEWFDENEATRIYWNPNEQTLLFARLDISTSGSATTTVLFYEYGSNLQQIGITTDVTGEQNTGIGYIYADTFNLKQHDIY